MLVLMQHLQYFTIRAQHNKHTRKILILQICKYRNHLKLVIPCGDPSLFAVELLYSCNSKLFFLDGLLDMDCMTGD